MTSTHYRWSDNDHCFGPFIYARDRRYRPFAVELTSAGEETPQTTFRVSALGRTLIAIIPAIIKPYREKKFPNWNAETVERMGRDWYWDIDKRVFGFSYHNGFLQVFRGRTTWDSLTDRTWGKHLPWTQWRHVRHTLYGLNGEYFWQQTGERRGPGCFDDLHEAQKNCPSISFDFEDFDGKHITAKTYIEEREWYFGTGYFKWLYLFRKPKVRRSLCINFSSETGRRKGSWKGGVLGSGIDMASDELHLTAFHRYCDEHEMKFIGVSQ